MTWNNLGIKDHQEYWLQERIRATNSVFKILMSVLFLLLITSLVFSTMVMTYFIATSLIILFATILIHVAGFHIISRILLAVLPVLVSSCIQGAYQMKGHLPNASGWVFIAAFQVLPFLLFAPSESVSRIIAISINLFISASYEQFNTAIELDQPPATPPVQVLITNMIGLLMMTRLLYTVDNLYKQANSTNEKLLAKVEKEKDDQREARKALDKTIAALNDARQQEALRTWASKGLAEAGKLLRGDDGNRMFDDLISFVVKYLSANQGAIFMNAKDEANTFLELKACYAYDRKKFLEKRVRIGEGLVGQCYLERSPIYLTDVPDGYIHITSGLGLATPACILIVPMIHNEKVFGVIEIASFQVIPSHHATFLLEVGEIVAIASNAVMVNDRTKNLLAETQMMAQQMRAQDESMRQNMEEIAAAREEQSRIEAELRKIIATQKEEIRALRQTQKTFTEDIITQH